MGKQKNHGVIRCANGAAFLQILAQASLRLSFQKPCHPGKPGVPRAFSGCQFLAILDLAQGAKKQGRSRSEGAMRLHNPVQARL